MSSKIDRIPHLTFSLPRKLKEVWSEKFMHVESIDVPVNESLTAELSCVNSISLQRLLRISVKNRAVISDREDR